MVAYKSAVVHLIGDTAQAGPQPDNVEKCTPAIIMRGAHMRHAELQGRFAPQGEFTLLGVDTQPQSSPPGVGGI